MYVIWKIGYERTIAWNNDPTKYDEQHEIHNKWLLATTTTTIMHQTSLWKMGRTGDELYLESLLLLHSCGNCSKHECKTQLAVFMDTVA